MKKHLYVAMLLTAVFTVMAITACSDDDPKPQPVFVKDASLVEEGKTLSPGESVHLIGNGYQKDDEVILNFYWQTGDPVLPESSIKYYSAEIQKVGKDGITIRLPYRKPESRVEVMLSRNGEMQLIGEAYVKDGTTPKEPRLYGINNNLHNKGTFTDAIQITRCASDDYGQAQWSLEAHPDFHSVVTCWRSYGLCGLSKTNGRQIPYFFDFCTSEWRLLDSRNTLALFNAKGSVGALQTENGIDYSLNIISDKLDISDDYATSKTRAAGPDPMPIKSYPLPDGMKAEWFGEYPGAFTNLPFFLFSANKGNGKWTPVILDISSGFRVLADIEADALIPYSFIDKDKKWRFGYIVARDNAVNGTELYMSDNAETLFDKPYAVFPNRAVSVSANYNNPGTLTVHFQAFRASNVTYDFIYDTNEWKSVDNASMQTFDEIVWTN